MKLGSVVATIIICVFMISGCSPKVGSDEWCKAMKSKPKGDWTANELSSFTEHCIFK